MNYVLVYTSYFPPGSPRPGDDCPDAMMSLAELIAIPIFITPTDREAELSAYIATMQHLIDSALEVMAIDSPA